MAELKWIEDLLDLSAAGNFTVTAESRNITQSALSKRMNQLEGWFGSTLFDRSPRAVILTAEGEASYLSLSRL